VTWATLNYGDFFVGSIAGCPTSVTQIWPNRPLTHPLHMVGLIAAVAVNSVVIVEAH
jgi:hypothetical protein